MSQRLAIEVILDEATLAISDGDWAGFARMVSLVEQLNPIGPFTEALRRIADDALRAGVVGASAADARDGDASASPNSGQNRNTNAMLHLSEGVPPSVVSGLRLVAILRDQLTGFLPSGHPATPDAIPLPAMKPLVETIRDVGIFLLRASSERWSVGHEAELAALLRDLEDTARAWRHQIVAGNWKGNLSVESPVEDR